MQKTDMKEVQKQTRLNGECDKLRIVQAEPTKPWLYIYAYIHICVLK